MNDEDERTQQNFCGGNLHEFRLVYKNFTWISIEDKTVFERLPERFLKLVVEIPPS